MEEVGSGGVFEATFASSGDGGAEGAGDYYLWRNEISAVMIELEGAEWFYIIWTLLKDRLSSPRDICL